MRVPPNLHAAIVAKAGEGRTLHEIAAWLKAEHGIVTSAQTVNKYVRRAKSERTQITQVVLREELGKSLLTDVEMLAKHQRQTDEMADLKYKAGDVEAYVKLVEQNRKVTETKLKYSGAEESDGASARGPIIFVAPESDD